MTRDELSREIADILAKGGRAEVVRLRILHAADSYAAAEAERICRPSLLELEQGWAEASANGRRTGRPRNSEREMS